MNAPACRRRAIVTAILAMAVVASVDFKVAHALQQADPAPKPEPVKGSVIRGCLTGSKLTHVDPQNVAPDLAQILPGTLNVRSIRVIRSQLKALNGHQVELIGTVRGIPGQETGLLVADSDKGKLYLGGGDARLGQDLVVSSNEGPTIYAQTVRNIADSCPPNDPN